MLQCVMVRALALGPCLAPAPLLQLPHSWNGGSSATPQLCCLARSPACSAGNEGRRRGAAAGAAWGSCI